MNAFYGDPDKNRDGLPDADFESRYLTFIEPPYPMVFSWNNQPVKKIRVHKKCAESLYSILSNIGKDFTIAEREKYQINKFGGCYNFRLMRGGNELSKHSWGCAIDLSPEINALGVEYGARPNMMPMKAVRSFELEGWKWGGRWWRGDSMHFEATS